MMLNRDNAVATARPPVALPSETVVVDTRFGVYEFTPDRTIMMPQGLIGFADHQLFGLGNLPAPVPEDFKLFQSLGATPISFVVMAKSKDESPVEAADLEEACKAIGFPLDEVQLMFLCTIREGQSGGVDMWANLCAPILLDLAMRQARQYVLPGNRYSMQQPIDKWTDQK